jgi:hypothetical protein
MAFSKSSLPLLLCPFINSFIMICESMLSASQDGLLREMLLSKYRLQIFDYTLYIYTISNTSSFEINWGFLVGAKITPPLIKHCVGCPLPSAVTNLFTRAFQRLKLAIGSRKCNPLENVYNLIRYLQHNV